MASMDTPLTGSSRARGASWPFVVLVALGAGASVGSSLTRPFTDGADVVVSLVLAAAVVVLSFQRRLGRVVPLFGRRPSRSMVEPPSLRRWLPWAIAAAVAVGWELGCLFSLPRSLHPTISSMLDAADGVPLGRGIAFAAWLALGWYLVTR
jgi:hypothetical protein